MERGSPGFPQTRDLSAKHPLRGTDPSTPEPPLPTTRSNRAEPHLNPLSLLPSTNPPENKKPQKTQKQEGKRRQKKEYLLVKPVEDKREPSEARAIKGGEPRKRSSATLPASPTLARLLVFFPASPPLPTPLIPARLSFKPHSQEQNIPPKPSSLCPANPPAPEDRETETGVPIAQDIMVQNVPTATPHKPYSHKHQTRHPAPSLHHNRSSDTPQPYVPSPPTSYSAPDPAASPCPASALLHNTVPCSVSVPR